MKKIILFLIIFFLFSTSCYALQYPNVESSSVIVFDKTDNKILYEKNSNEVKSIASLTKIVTTIVAIEKINNYDESVIITSDIINSVDWSASKAGLHVGDKVTYRDLLYASILPSGADATNALAILLSGSVENYVSEMNDFAKKHGLINTNFVNVTGLDDENHYSCASDVLSILNYALDNELFYNVFSTKKYTLSNGLDVYSTLYKYNGDDVSQIVGGKTGFTGNAGYCIATLSKKDNHDIIIILLDAGHHDGKYYNIVDSLELINFVDNNYSNKLLMKKNSVIDSLNVELCKTSSYKIKSNVDIYKFLPNDFDTSKFRYDYSGEKVLNYKSNKGSKIGKVNYYYDNEVIYTEDVILSQKFEISYIKLVKKYLVYEIIGVLFLIIMILYIIIGIGIKKNEKNVIL